MKKHLIRRVEVPDNFWISHEVIRNVWVHFHVSHIKNL